MSMDFSTSIQGFNTEFNLNAVRDYNKFLQKQDAFDFDAQATEFSKALENASKSIPLQDKNDPTGLGMFASQIGASLTNGLNAVNNAKLYSERLEEDIAMGFRRLSIIDVEGAPQPLFNEDKSLVLMFNGEIYNYQSIREELIAALQATGFELIDIHGDIDFTPPTEESERWYFVARAKKPEL